jgi:hypothetical protein
MPPTTTPITLTPIGGLPYGVIRGHLVMLYSGAWILDLELNAEDVTLRGMPSGKCAVLFGGVPMVGTIDPINSGTWGPTARARVVAGGNGWSTTPVAQDWHADSGVLSTVVYAATAAAVGEVLVDVVPELLGVDFIRAGKSPLAIPGAPPLNIPAKSVFGDKLWWVDVTGTTYVAPARPKAIPDLSLVLRDWDPVNRKVSFSCDTLLLPGTPLVDLRFGTQLFTVYNVEQIFDASGSTGWAWASSTVPILGEGSPLPPPPATTLVDDLKAAVLHWTRAELLRPHRYRLILYAGLGPAGGPQRMALQAIAPTAGVPDLIPIAPWSGVAGMVSQLAPSQEVLVVFENADPTLPRVVSYSLVALDGEPMAIPLKTTLDARVELDLGVLAPLVIIGGPTATPVATAAAVAATEAFANAVVAAVTPPPATLPQCAASLAAIGTAATTLASALGAPTALTLRTKAA